eukprot:2276648-Prymnesium_polylepis.2
MYLFNFTSTLPEPYTLPDSASPWKGWRSNARAEQRCHLSIPPAVELRRIGRRLRREELQGRRPNPRHCSYATRQGDGRAARDAAQQGHERHVTFFGALLIKYSYTFVYGTHTGTWPMADDVARGGIGALGLAPQLQNG